MHHHKETRVLPYTPQQMFDLVADIEKYPEFLPWCTSAKIVERAEGEVSADVMIGYGPLHETYTSRVTLDRAKRIEVVGIKGPFRYLNNTWEFSRAKGGCSVVFCIDFAFKSFLLQTMMGAVFHRAVAHMVTAFEDRACRHFAAVPKRRRRTETASSAS